MARILIVEDHPTMRDAMRLVLEEDGHEVEEVTDGEAGIAAVRARPEDYGRAHVVFGSRPRQNSFRVALRCRKAYRRARAGARS